MFLFIPNAQVKINIPKTLVYKTLLVLETRDKGVVNDINNEKKESLSTSVKVYFKHGTEIKLTIPRDKTITTTIFKVLIMSFMFINL